ncbi:Fe2+-dependent dioxygenase [Xylophilus sp. GOD-11R]|uniref:Fe2+-dependent dioxygenase n=1 Tax=Xylophilus sp. GOD-11R TaxID=3089814 RepID=UPI00298D36F0|nr:Fe2+-dependent dioxygenase [Xylophilus sp. GOD-11R]WPB57477.1 Fe2+-dependent dioxygenase [Xylophilus sp. GOD-11R]
MLLHVPQVLTAAQVAEFRQQLAEADWTDGRATVGAQGAAVKRNRQLPASSAVSQRLAALVLTALARHELYFSAALPLRTVAPLFNRYEGGEHYGLHVDGAVRSGGEGQPAIRTDLSATLFLSEPDEYDGGNLVVVDTYGSHEVKLPAGDLVLYPASSLHGVEPVTRGARIGSFFWIQSLVRDDARRGQLFELDQTIQRLRAKLGETDESLSLTNHYHNLLRMWAET